ncbi:MAG: alpha/beta hydrolase, partial [Mesorhizobium sp.]
MSDNLRSYTIRLDNGLSVPCVEHGNPAATPLLLLHGYTDSWRS